MVSLPSAVADMVKVRANLGLLHLHLALSYPQSRKVCKSLGECKDRIGMTMQTGAGMVHQTGAGMVHQTGAGMANQIGAGMTKQTGARMTKEANGTSATQAGSGSHMIQIRAQIDQTCAAVAATFDVKATTFLAIHRSRGKH